MANVIHRINVDKLGGSYASNYIGNKGDAFYDPDNGNLRISDGSTVGGKDIITNSANSPLIAFAGDSITAMAVYTSGLSVGNHPYAPSTWLMGMLGQRARTDHSLNFGVSGNTTAQLLARIDAVCACRADYVVVLIGTNDINGGVTETTLPNYKENMIGIINALQRAGKTVIIVPVLPRNLATASHRAVLISMRNWTIDLQWSGRRGLYIADAGSEYGNPLSATYSPKSGNDYDGLHPQQRGAYEIAKAIYRVIDRLIPPVAQGLISVADTYDATYNPTGNLLTNGLLDGTTGGLSTTKGLISTGSQVATGWNMNADAPYSGATALQGLTLIGSKGVSSDGRPEQIYTMSGSYTGDIDSYIGLFQNLGTFSRFNVGDVLEATAEITLDPSVSELPLSAPRLRLSIGTPIAGNVVYEDMNRVANGYAPKEGYTLLMRTPRMMLTEIPTSGAVSIHFIPRQGVNTLANNAVWRMRGISLRKIIQG